MNDSISEKGKCCKVFWEEGGFCGLFVALLSCFSKCSHRLQVHSTADFQMKEKFCFSLRCEEISEHYRVTSDPYFTITHTSIDKIIIITPPLLLKIGSVQWC